MNIIDYSLICKALGDTNRLQIVNMLSGEEKCACKLLEQFEISQPTLSHHMHILCGCGLVNVKKDGKWSYYTLNQEVLNTFKTFINGLNACNAGGCTCK